MPIRSDIDPMRILAKDERNFLFPPPPLQLSLARQRPVHIIVGLPIKQSRHIVLRGESFEVVEFVLEDALMQVPAEADLERSGKAAHDVDTVVFSILRHGEIFYGMRSIGNVTDHT